MRHFQGIANRQHRDGTDVEIGQDRQGEWYEAANPGVFEQNQRLLAALVDQQLLYRLPMRSRLGIDLSRIESPPVIPAGIDRCEQFVMSRENAGALKVAARVPLVGACQGLWSGHAERADDAAERRGAAAMHAENEDGPARQRKCRATLLGRRVTQ